MVEVAGTVSERKETDYERSDANVKGILITAVAGLGTLGAIVISLVVSWHWVMEASYPKYAPPLAREEIVPPPPRLHAHPAIERQRLDTAQSQALEQYGWTDRERRIAHIPIERAMELIVEQGWPGDPGGSEVGGPPAEPQGRQ